jgi:TP901 family phage tail tape measure protein
MTNAETAQIRQTMLLNREHERQSAAMRRLGQDIGQVNASQAQSIQYMGQWIRQQEGLSTATVHATGAINNANGSFQTYRAAVSEAGGATHNYRMAVNTATGEVYQLDQGIRTTSVSLRDMSSILRAVRTVIGFTGIAQSMRSAFTEMKSMSDELVTYRKVTGATAQEMERIRTSAYETSKKYGQTPSDFLNQAATMARAGYGQNATAMAELATKTQLVGDMTADAASKFLIAVDAAYQLGGSVETLTHILDGANVIDNNYATTIEKISEGMTLTASLASSAHVPVEQLTAALGTMTAVTQRSGTETARGLRQIMLNIIGDTTTEIEEGVTVAEEEMSAMQQALMRYTPEVVKAAQATGKLINPMEAIAALAKQYKEGLLTETELFGITESIGGKRYYNVFTALIQNYDMYEEMLQKVMQSTGSADAEVAAMLDGWTAKANQLSATWTQVVNNTVSENFIKGLLDGGRQALEFAGNLENLAIMAGGAYEAIRSLTTGIANLRSGAQFGGFNIATGVLGLAITGLGAWKAAYEKNIRDMQKEAAEAVSNAISKATDSATLESIQKRYNEIVADGLQEEKGELEELKTLQSQLNGLVGGQETAIDLVNGKYEDTIKLLKSMTEEQRKAAMTDLIAARSKAVAAFNQSDLNGDLGFGGDTGVMLPMLKNKESEWLRHYIQLNTEFFSVGDASVFQGGLAGTQRLNISKPTDAESIIRLMTEAENLYKLFGTKTSSGGEVTQGLKSMGEEYSGVYAALGSFMEKLRSAGNDVVKAQQAIDDFDKELKDLSETTEEGSKGFKDAAESAYTLEKAIEGATKAKEKFDDAMKTSKADAFNDYVKAFQTLQGEINAGRVNSTAFYASARMLLGDDAYNQTGGTSEGVMAALNRKGSSGTLNRAGELLFGEYYDASGNAYEGAGLIELLRNTKGYSNRITQNASGGWNIPGLTEADVNEISAAWGGLSKDLIMSFFEALDQYDVKGAATAEAVKASKTETAGAGTTTEKPELPDRVIEQQNRLAESTQALGEAQEKAAEQTAEALQTVENATSETEELKEVNPDTTKARTDAEEWLALLTSIEEAYARINTQTVGYSPDLERLFEDIDKLREEITLNIKTGAGTGTAALMASVLSAAITTIEGYAKNGTISVTLAGALTGNLKDGLAKIIDDAQSIEELKAIELALTGNPSQLDTDVDLVIAKENLKKVVLTATAETKDAEDQIDKAAEDRDTTIKVKQSGAKYAGEQIDTVAQDRTVTITVQTKTAPTVKNSAPSTNSIFHNGGSVKDVIEQLVNEQGGRQAQGTRSHPGGLSIVNDEKGPGGYAPELIIDNGRAFIAGGGRPAIVSLNKGAKVFTASETRQIFSGSGVPSYAKGTAMTALGGSSGTPPLPASVITSGGVVTGGGYTTEKPGGSTDDGKKTSSGSSSGSSNEKKTDEKAFENLSAMVDYIVKRIGEALDEQLDIIDKQIDALKQQKDALDAQNELEEKQKAVAEAQRDLETALSERTIRYLGEDGKWHWMADARNVQAAQENLQKAQDALSEYQQNAAYEAEVAALEAQKKALQEEYNGIADAWSKIQAGVETPTGDLAEMISTVLTGGTPQQQTGASAIRDYLIGKLLTGGSYSGNYSEALDSIAKATAGSPIMPDGSNTSLAALIATGGGLTGSTAEALRVMNGGVTSSVTGAFGDGGTHINYNYFVNGMEIGAEAAQGMTLSEVMRSLTVYAGQ